LERAARTEKPAAVRSSGNPRRPPGAEEPAEVEVEVEAEVESERRWGCGTSDGREEVAKEEEVERAERVKNAGKVVAEEWWRGTWRSVWNVWRWDAVGRARRKGRSSARSAILSMPRASSWKKGLSEAELSTRQRICSRSPASVGFSPSPYVPSTPVHDRAHILFAFAERPLRPDASSEPSDSTLSAGYSTPHHTSIFLRELSPSCAI
jgi:hypothetical protein